MTCYLDHVSYVQLEPNSISTVILKLHGKIVIKGLYRKGKMVYVKELDTKGDYNCFFGFLDGDAEKDGKKHGGKAVLVEGLFKVPRRQGGSQYINAT